MIFLEFRLLNGKNKYCMKEQIIKIIESKAQGKYHLEIDESDLEVMANEILKLFDVMVLFKPNELWRMAQKYNCDDFTQMIEQSKRLNKL
tara:strand:- start:6295 stop:6564 length:270 start_codon:yes stop_codon:yes gene_type:complete